LEKPAEDEDARSTASGFYHDDPFEYASDCQGKDTIERPRETYVYRTKDLVYLDEGYKYTLLDSRSDEKNSALQDELLDHAEEELKEDIRAGMPQPPSQAERNEAIQWLMQDPDRYTGPEQLWVKLWIFHGDEDVIAGLQERTSLFVMTAGSLEEVSASDYWSVEYCVDGRTVTSREAEMAMQYPGLWAWKCIPLSMPGDGSSQSLKPAFEFFEERPTNTTSDDDLAKDLVRARSVEKTPLSTFGLIKNWLSNCVKNHPRCNRGWAPSPTRLIKVLDADGDPVAKLVDSAHELVGAEFDVDTYAILSHSWGPDRSVISTLTIDNQQELKHSIDVSTLCPSFQDAIAITRGIGLRYIWIDALCIIQDSSDDWQHESAMMSAYYQGCLVMISAFSSISASERILRTRDLGPTTSIQIDGHQLGIRRLLQNATSVASHLETNHYSVREKIAHRPLSERAWTFQEYASAPRIIHFTTEQVIWQCETCLASEDGQYTMSSNTLPATALEKARKQRDKWYKDKDKDKDKGNKNRVRRPTLVSAGWYDIVEKYTARRITFTADILPALAAIAQQMHIVTNATYCAGLWKGGPNTLFYNLLWETDTYHDTAPLPAHNGSPSWSWSSIRGKIGFMVDNDMYRIPKPHDPKILDMCITLTSPDFKHGKVERGVLELEGWHHVYTGPNTFADFHAHGRKARFEQNDDAENARRQKFDTPESYLNPIPQLSTMHMSCISEADESWNEDQNTRHYGIGKLDIPNGGYDWQSGEHVVLFVSEYNEVSEPASENFSSEQCYLVLRRCESELRDAVPMYRRVGCAVARYYALDVSVEREWTRGKIRIV
jgi:hypothetical protein